MGDGQISGGQESAPAARVWQQSAPASRRPVRKYAEQHGKVEALANDSDGVEEWWDAKIQSHRIDDAGKLILTILFDGDSDDEQVVEEIPVQSGRVRMPQNRLVPYKRAPPGFGKDLDSSSDRNGHWAMLGGDKQRELIDEHKAVERENLAAERATKKEENKEAAANKKAEERKRKSREKAALGAQGGKTASEKKSNDMLVYSARSGSDPPPIRRAAQEAGGSCPCKAHGCARVLEHGAEGVAGYEVLARTDGRQGSSVCFSLGLLRDRAGLAKIVATRSSGKPEIIIFHFSSGAFGSRAERALLCGKPRAYLAVLEASD